MRVTSILPPAPAALAQVDHLVNVVDPIQVRGRVIPADELSWRFSRSSGPGGQSVNTSDSRVELSYDLAASSALGPVLRERALAALADRLVNGVLTISASEHPVPAPQPGGGHPAADQRADRRHRGPSRHPAADQAHPWLAGTPPGGQAAPLPDQETPPLHR